MSSGWRDIIHRVPVSTVAIEIRHHFFAMHLISRECAITRPWMGSDAELLDWMPVSGTRQCCPPERDDFFTLHLNKMSKHFDCFSSISCGVKNLSVARIRHTNTKLNGKQVKAN